MLGVLRGICTVVGAVVLYCAVAAALWYGLTRAARRRGRRQAERLAAASMIPVLASDDPAARERPPRSWEELPSWLWQDRPWAVAVVLLGAPAVRGRTAPFLDFGNRVIDWTALLEESRSWAPDQRLVVQSAYELCMQVSAAAAHPRTG